MFLATARRSLSVFALTLMALFGSEGAPCQVPAGWWISAHHASPTSPGLGGLWLHHPTGAAPSIAISGLSSGLTGAGLGGVGTTIGAASVTLVERTGTIVYVGEVIPGTLGSLDTLDLHRITLAGTTAVSDVVVGTLPLAGGSTPRISSLAPTYITDSPATEPYVLMTLSGLAGGAPQLAVYHTATGLNIVPSLYGMPMGTPTAVTFTNGFPSTTIAVVYAGATTIVTVNITFGSASYQAGPVTTLATIPASVAAMDFDETTGLIYCACNTGGVSHYTVNVATGLVTALPVGGSRSGVAYDRETGTLATVGTAFGVPGSIARSTLGGGTIVLGTAPPTGWGIPTGVDLRHSMRTVEAGPGMFLDVNWNTPWALAAAGVANLPVSGNAAWGFSVSPSVFAPITAYFGISLAPSPLPIPFGTPPLQMLLIDLSPASFLGVLSASGFGVAAVPFPIPPGFVGTELWIQGLCAVATAPAPILTDALALTIL
jgi:hypothetical protein